MNFKHPTSGARITVLTPYWHRLWCLLFGCLYYLAKGMWGWALISLLTMNGLLIGLPLFNRAIVRGYYVRAGWIELNG